MHVLPRLVAERVASLRRLVGDTVLLEIRLSFRGRDLAIYCKHEVQNFTGSIKDRMALFLLERAWERGEIEPGAEIVEATSGNTGISFAAIGRALGHPVRIYLPDWLSQERVALLRAFGAELVPVSAADGGFVESIRRADEWAREHSNAFRPRQFDSPGNITAHELTTGPEILAQLAAIGLAPTGFVAGVGTGGTVMGVGRALRAALGDDVAIHPLEPSNSPTLRAGHRVGTHRIQGISDEFVPPICDLEWLDEIVDVRDGDAIRMAQELAEHLGLGVGISSGANLLGAVQVAVRQGPGSVVATVFPDSNKKYLSTDLLRAEPMREGDLAPHIELTGCRVLPRLGATVLDATHAS